MKKVLLTVLLCTLALSIALPAPALAHSGISTILTMTVEQVGDADFELTIKEYNDSPYWKDDPDLRDVWIDLQPLGYTLVKGDGYYVGGDLDDDGLLDGAHTQMDVGETWEWVVPVTVTGPTTFVAIGHGITYDGWDITYDPDAAWPWPNGLIAHDEEERAEVTVGPSNAPAISIEKLVDCNGDGIFLPRDTGTYGDTPHWYIKVTNIGNCPVLNIMVTDTNSMSFGPFDLVNPSDYWEADYIGDPIYETTTNTAEAVGEDDTGATVGPVYASATNVIPQLYNICGFKYLAGTEDGLGGWEISLYIWDESLEPADWVLIATTTTDEYGKYCFTNLEAGDYKVSETLKEGWVQISPEGNEHLVTLPGGASDCETGPFYNFENEREKVCYDETAWAYGGPEEDYGAEGDVAKHNNKVPGNPSNAWGWTNYFDGDTEFPVVMDLWAGAGQNDTRNGFKVGTVTVGVEGDCVTVTYEIDEEYSMTEAHLWVGETPLPLVIKKGVATPTSAPGLFPYSADETICGVDVEGGFWVAAHAVIEWCEIVCPE